MFAYRTVLPQKSMNHFSIIVYLRDPKPFLSLCDFWRVRNASLLAKECMQTYYAYFLPLHFDCAFVYSS